MIPTVYKLPKSKKQRAMLRIVKGGLEPADSASVALLRDRNYRVGDIVAADLTKPRNPLFNGLAHRIGGLVAENIESFSALDSHRVLKRIQIEGNIACDEIGLMFPGVGPCPYRIPQSLSFESMDEGIFKQTVSSMCQHIAKNYWPTLTAEEVERMAESWVEPI